jgi:hypothetical protein
LPTPKTNVWSGYCEAVAGGKLARNGLTIALAFRLVNQTVPPKRALEMYRSYLYESGQPRAAGLNGQKPRRGFTPEEIDEVLANGGKLQQALLCRLRYFIGGAALGSRSFLEGVFKSHRICFGPKRNTGARALRGIRAPGLFVARALRVRPIG